MSNLDFAHQMGNDQYYREDDPDDNEPENDVPPNDVVGIVLR
jgi:hypothetical protein